MIQDLPVKPRLPGDDPLSFRADIFLDSHCQQLQKGLEEVYNQLEDYIDEIDAQWCFGMQYWNQLRDAINDLQPDNAYTTENAKAKCALKETFEDYDKQIQASIRLKQKGPKFCILQ